MNPLRSLWIYSPVGRAARGAGRALSKGWQGTKAAASTIASGGPFGLLSGIFPVTTGEPPAMGTRDLLEGHDTMPWLRALGDKVSTAVGGTDWRLYAGKPATVAAPAKTLGGPISEASLQRFIGSAVSEVVDARLRRFVGKLSKGAVRDRIAQRAIGPAREKQLEARRRLGQLEEIEDHVFFDMIDKPNPYMDRLGLFKLTNLHLDLVGDAYWIKERNVGGVWVGSWPVPPHWVIEQPTPARPYFRIVWRAWSVRLPLSEVVWFHEPSPVHPYTRGSGVGWSVGDEVEVDEYAAKMAKALFFNQARPDVVIYGFDNAKEKKEVERDWLNRLQGFWRAHKPYFMTGEPKFHEFQRPNMEQLVYPALRESQRDIVMQVWGTPPEMFGISKAGNLARTAYEAAEYLFTKYVVASRSEKLRGVMQREVESEYDERLVLSYTSPVPDDKEYELSVIKSSPWAFTADELRARAGLGPDPIAGKGRLVPMNSYVTQDPLDQTGRPQGAGAAMRATDQTEEAGKANV